MAEKRPHGPNGSDVPPKITKISSSQDTLLMKDEAVGIIESVTLKNFMCHEHLHFKFGPRINLIRGKNGSGKSAVLTAIVVGLGGRACDTKRGKNLSEYVKTGKQVCEIAIALRNCGLDAYKPEIYGSSITVVRRLTISGTNSYKLKAENGELISTKRSDLIHVLDNFNIQINNPISILNQEDSRVFLSTKGPKDKYKFFFRATQLEQLKEDYTLAQEQRKITEDILERKRKNLPTLKKEVEYWEEKWKFHQSLEKEHEKMEELKDEFTWAYIMELEKDVNDKRKELENMGRSILQLKSKLDESEVHLSNLKEEREKKFNMLKNIDQEIEKLQVTHHDFKNVVEKRKHVLRKNEFTLQRLKEEVKNKSREIKGLQDKIKEIKHKGEGDNTDEKKKILEKIQQHEKKVNRLIAELKTTEVHYKNLESSVTKYREDLYCLRQGEKELEERFTKLKRSLVNLECSRTNGLRQFGRFTPELLQQIDAAYKKGKFTQKPKGPVGMYIKLKDTKWALAVESCLKNLLFSFCCDSYRDQQVLQSIMKNVMLNEKKPAIIISKFTNQVYDTRKFAVQTNKYPSLLGILLCEDPVVVNCLIDQRNIEQILLIENNDDARHVMLNAVPKNCRGSFTLDGDQLFPFPSFRYYSCKKQKVEYLQRNVEDQITETRAEMKAVERNLLDLQKQISENNDIFKSNQKELHISEKRIRELSQEINHCNSVLEELKSCEESEEVDVRALEEDALALEVDKNKLQKMVVEKESEYNADKNLYEDKLKEANCINDQLCSLWKECEPYKNSLNQLDTEMECIKSNKQCHEARLKDHVHKMTTYEVKVSNAQKLLKEELQKAEKICARVNTKRTPQSIEAEIRQLEHNLLNREKNYGRKEDVEAKYFETKKRFFKIEKEINSMSIFLKKFRDVLHQRLEAFIHIRQQLSLRVKYLFKNILFIRRYVGNIVFDHKNETLEIKVQPNVPMEKLNSDMGSLSGGERSYTTVSFMLALWDCVESPFRILDEFEVYMDMVNRQVTMDMIIETCSLKGKTQFIFLSPLEMTKMEMSPLIVIHTMPKPARDKKASSNNAERTSDK